MKNLFKKVLTGALIGAALMGKPQKADAAEVYFDLRTNFGVNYDLRKSKLYDFHKSVRDISRHPDDDYTLDKDVKPIKDRFVSTPNFDMNFQQTVGFGVKQHFDYNYLTGFDFKFGLGGKIFLFALPDGFPERNYTNHPGTSQEGEGAALTYYKPNQMIFSPEVYMRGSYYVGPFNVFMEYAPEFNFLTIENGWDRYNGLEQKNSYYYAATFDQLAKLGIDLRIPCQWDTDKIRGYVNIEAYAGLGFPTILAKNSSLCKEKHLSDPYVIFGGSLGFNIEVPIKKD